MTEIEIDGVGTYRLPNQWQGQRLRRLRGEARHTAVLAIGCGMTVRQFNKLPADKQHEVHRAYLKLMSPSNVVPLADPAPAETRAIPRGHLSVDQKLAVGRWLLKVKASMPHEDLVGLFVCSHCKAAGRDRRPVFFTCIPDYQGQDVRRFAAG